MSFFAVFKSVTMVDSPLSKLVRLFLISFMFVFKSPIVETNLVTPVKKAVPSAVTLPFTISSNKMAVEHCKSSIPFLKVDALASPIAQTTIIKSKSKIRKIDGQ